MSAPDTTPPVAAPAADWQPLAEAARALAGHHYGASDKAWRTYRALATPANVLALLAALTTLQAEAAAAKQDAFDNLRHWTDATVREAALRVELHSVADSREEWEQAMRHVIREKIAAEVEVDALRSQVEVLRGERQALEQKHVTEVLDILRDMRLPQMPLPPAEYRDGTDNWQSHFVAGQNLERRAVNAYCNQKAYEYNPQGIGPDPTKVGQWDTRPKSAATPVREVTRGEGSRGRGWAMNRCHHVTVDGERIFIPFCYSSLYEDSAWACTCRPATEVKMASAEAKQRLVEAEKEIHRLERLLWKLTKHKHFAPKRA